MASGLSRPILQRFATPGAMKTHQLRHSSPMRQVIGPQLRLGEQDIAAIEFDPKSRDDIPQLLRGLQHIYVTPDLRARVFAILEEVVPIGLHGPAATDTGRPGMDQWKILVLGSLRLGLNIDYDRRHNTANEHLTVRRMLGHPGWAEADRDRYELQTIKDNLRLFTPAIWERINHEVVCAGHVLVKKSPDEPLQVRVDSFVVETQVHYPTDINLLWDAIRVLIRIVAGLCEDFGIAGWRQSAYRLREFKKLFRCAQQRKRRSRTAGAAGGGASDTQQAHRAYIEQAERLLVQLRETRCQLVLFPVAEWVLAQIDLHLGDAERQIDQIRRRVLCGQTIPHEEKVFSIFQRHTEWIVKGKAGVPVELGLRVAVVEDQHRFILTHHVMEKTTDDQVAVPLMERACASYRAIAAASFDKGFHSPANQIALAERVPRVVMPKKGKCSQTEQARESDPEFIRLRHRRHWFSLILHLSSCL
jgi:transposase, IS5 family